MSPGAEEETASTSLVNFISGVPSSLQTAPYETTPSSDLCVRGDWKVKVIVDR